NAPFARLVHFINESGNTPLVIQAATDYYQNLRSNNPSPPNLPITSRSAFDVLWQRQVGLAATARSYAQIGAMSMHNMYLDMTKFLVDRAAQQVRGNDPDQIMERIVMDVENASLHISRRFGFEGE
ncbi:hypothetical protein RZS08_52580, partial [Arthrospira platensis SPKY1]|nr:hypothetical protein [Arthrospira platensis SPKY1]